MCVNDFCRFCKIFLRVNGSLSNTKKIFDANNVTNEKSVNERLIALGLTLSKDNSRSIRICRSCFRVLRRLEEDFAIFRKWQEAEKQTSPEASTATVYQVPCVTAELKISHDQASALSCEAAEMNISGDEASMSAVEKRVPCVAPGFSRSLEDTIMRIKLGKRDMEETLTPSCNKRVCPTPEPDTFPNPSTPVLPPTRKLPKPTTEMPARRSLTEVVIRYPSHPKGERMTCQANTAGIVENIAKKKWRRAANLIVRHKELFGQLKKNVLQVVEDESKVLCNPNKGFMLWRSSADDLKAFSFADLQSDLERLSPFIFSVFSQMTKQSRYSTCAAAAIALRGREPRLSAFAYYVDGVLLQYGRVKKDIFKKLSKLGITTSHTCALGKQRELANTDGQRLKVANTIFLNSQKENEPTDIAEGGDDVKEEDNTVGNNVAETTVIL